MFLCLTAATWRNSAYKAARMSSESPSRVMYFIAYFSLVILCCTTRTLPCDPLPSYGPIRKSSNLILFITASAFDPYTGVLSCGPCVIPFCLTRNYNPPSPLTTKVIVSVMDTPLSYYKFTLIYRGCGRFNGMFRYFAKRAKKTTQVIMRQNWYKRRQKKYKFVAKILK